MLMQAVEELQLWVMLHCQWEKKNGIITSGTNSDRNSSSMKLYETLNKSRDVGGDSGVLKQARFKWL